MVRRLEACLRGERWQINGVTLNVAMAGAGLPLLLLHGFTGSMETWRPHVAALAAHARVIAVDLPGHGGSGAPADPARYAMARVVDDLLALLDRLEVARAGVLGYSLGARAGLHIVTAAPRRVAVLIMESGSPGLESEEERRARRVSDEALAARIEREGVDAFVAYWERLPLFATQERLSLEARQALQRERRRHSAVGLANSLRGMGTGAQESLWARLDGVDVPTLLVTGALDEKFSAIGRSMAVRMPRASLAVVPGAGHAVHLERPDEFDRLVGDFVDAHTRDAGLREEDALCL